MLLSAEFVGTSQVVEEPASLSGDNLVLAPAVGGFMSAWIQSDFTGATIRRFNWPVQSAGNLLRNSVPQYAAYGGNQLAADADGNFAIVWGQRLSDMNANVIGVRLYAADGSPRTNSWFIRQGEFVNDTMPSVAMAPDGRFVVAWRDGVSRIVSQRFTKDGAPVGSLMQVSTTWANAFPEYPSVAIADNGSFAVAWDQRNPSTFTSVLQTRAARFGWDGSTLASDFAVSPAGSLADNVNPACAIASNGNLLVTWFLSGPQASTRRIMLSAFDATGAALSSATVSFRPAAYPPQMSFDGAEGIVAWTGTDASKNGVFARRVSETGGALGAPFRVNDYQTFDQNASSVLEYEHRFVVGYSGTFPNNSGVQAGVRLLDDLGDADAIDVLDTTFTLDTSIPLVSARGQQLTVSFSAPIASSLENEALLLINKTTGVVQTQFSASLSGEILTIIPLKTSQPGAPVIFSDGNWELHVANTDLGDAAGNPLARGVDFSFFVLSADGNRDRSVDINDFNLLAANFGKTGQTFSQGNYDYSADGKVSISDFNILAANFGRHLDAPVGTAALTTATQTRSIGEVNSTSSDSRWLIPAADDTSLLSESGLV